MESEDENFCARPKRGRILTPTEIVTAGLQNNKTKKLKFINMEDRGRGVVAEEKIAASEFVVEYKYSESYPPKEKAKRDHEYIANNEGCYILEAQLPENKGWLCMDATRNLNCWGRYINHSVHPNLKKNRPLMVRGKWRVGFTAIHDIQIGEELTYDYGKQPNPPLWLARKKGNSATKVQSTTTLAQSDLSTPLTLSIGDSKNQLPAAIEMPASKTAAVPAANVEISPPSEELSQEPPSNKKQTEEDFAIPCSQMDLFTTAPSQQHPSIAVFKSDKLQQSSIVSQQKQPTATMSHDICIQSDQPADVPNSVSQEDRLQNPAVESQLADMPNSVSLQNPAVESQLADMPNSVSQEERLQNPPVESQLADTVSQEERLRNPAVESQQLADVPISEQDLLTCEACIHGANAKSFCTTCQNRLCDNCHQIHKRMKIFSSHSIQPLKKELPKEEDTKHASQEITCSCCTANAKAEQSCINCGPVCNDCITQHQVLTIFVKHKLVPLLEEDVKPKTCGCCLSQAEAEQFCLGCNTPICDTCISQHKKMRIFAQHRLVYLDVKVDTAADEDKRNRSPRDVTDSDVQVDSSEEHSSEEEDAFTHKKDVKSYCIEEYSDEKEEFPTRSEPMPDDDEGEGGDGEGDEDDEHYQSNASDDLDQLCILGVDNTQVYRVKKQDRVLLPGYNGPLEGPSSQPIDCSPILVNPANDEDIHNTSTSDEDQPEFDESAVGTKRSRLSCNQSRGKLIRQKIFKRFKKRTNKERFRKYRMCPIPGCKSKPQKKLPNHFTKFHPEIGRREKKKLLKRAKIVDKDHITDPTQTTLKTTPSTPIVKTEANPNTKPTRSLGRFASTHPQLVGFKDYLMGLGGKRRSEKSAEAIVRDVSKSLYFHNGEEVVWDNIVDRLKLLQYMQRLDELNVGPEGQLTKLERVCDALQYIKLGNREDSTLTAKICALECEIKVWKRTLRVAKNALQIKRIEMTSEMDLSMDQITTVVDNPDMWMRFSDIINQISSGKGVTDFDLKLAMGIAMQSVLLKSSQRPGAVTNCTIDEYRAATTCGNTTVIKVFNHKTSTQGTAKLTMDQQLFKRLQLYFEHVRPLLVEPGADIPNLFILPGSQKVNKYSNVETFLKRHLRIDIPSATMARKIASTCAAKSCDYQTNQLVTQQMSHQPHVSSRYYQAVHGSSNAAYAFETLESLRNGTKPPQYPATSSMPSTSDMSSPHEPLPPQTTETKSKWRPSDTKIVEVQFRKYIAERTTPGLSECNCLTTLALGKTPKQIQDKVRTIIRQKKVQESLQEDD